MSQQVTLTIPEVKPQNASYKIDRIVMDVPAGIFYVQLLGQNNEVISKTYNVQTTPTGLSLIIALNKANLSVKSLQQRIFEQLIADGVLVGSITGSVD